MICFSEDKLRGYLLQELPAEIETRVEEHVSSCDTCRRTLDALTSDDLVPDYFEAARRDAKEDQHTVASSSHPPDWQPFSGDDLWAVEKLVLHGIMVLPVFLARGRCV